MAEKNGPTRPQNESATPGGTCPAYATEEYQGNFRKRTGR